MIDREKVIKGLSSIDLRVKNELTFGSAGEETTIEKKEIAQWEPIIEDALALLSEKPVEPKIYPETRYSGPLVACGECRRELTDGRPRFCPYCGRQIRWED